MLWTLIGIAVLAWVGQLVLGLYQMRRFMRHVKEMRTRYGKVAIGKAKGGLRAGCILLLAIDDQHTVTHGEIFEGVTVFTRFRPFEQLNGLHLLSLDETALADLPKQQRIAALSAKDDLTKYLEGKHT